MDTKVCKECGVEKLATKEYFYAEKDCKDGLRPKCKECENKLKKKYREVNRDEIILRQHNQYIQNRDKRLKKQKEYWEHNRDERSEYSKGYREKNKFKLREKAKEYYYNNIEERRKYNKEYVSRTKDEKTKYNNQYYQNNRNILIENVKKYNEIYYKTDHFKILARKKNHKRRAIKKQLEASLNIEQWEKCKKHFNNLCCYCGTNAKLSQEHFIPLSNGGEYTINNIVPACKSCNSSKGNRNFFKWYPNQGFYNKKREQKILKYLNYDKETEVQQLTLTI